MSDEALAKSEGANDAKNGNCYPQIAQILTDNCLSNFICAYL